MQIMSPDLKITKETSLKHYSTQQTKHFSYKLVIKLKINFDSFDTNRQKFISYFADEIVEAKSMQRMREILSEVGYYVVVQVENYLNKKHEVNCVIDLHEYHEFHINGKLLSFKSLKWFNEAHKLVYGREIPNLNSFIQKAIDKFRNTDKDFLYRTVTNQIQT